MKKFLLLTAYCLLLTAASAQEVTGNMPAFYEQLKATLTYPLAWQQRGDRSFEEWQAEARAALHRCLEPAPPTAPFDVEYLDKEVREGYTAHRIALNLSALSRVTAYLLVPEGEGPFPAVVMFHDHGAHFTIGKEKLVQPFAVSDTVAADAQQWVEKYYDATFVGDRFAREGYVVIAVDALLWGDRCRKEGASYDAQQALAANLLQMGTSWGALIVHDDVRTVEFAASLPTVDATRIGVMGFSMGAHRAWMTAAASERVSAAAAVCWMSTTESLMTPTNNQSRGGSAFSMIIPQLRRYLDYPHVATLACPRPILFINGERDKLFPTEGVQEAYRQMEEVWHAAGAADHFTATLYDAPHLFNGAMQTQVLHFFDKWLKR